MESVCQYRHNHEFLCYYPIIYYSRYRSDEQDISTTISENPKKTYTFDDITILLGKCELVIIWNSTDLGEREFLCSFELEFEKTAQLHRSIMTPDDFGIQKLSYLIDSLMVYYRRGNLFTAIIVYS